MTTNNISKNVLSVVIPAYNCKNFLENAVQSVRKQKYADSLIILVDDGSTDGTSELCDKLASLDKRIIVIHKENGGFSNARNCAIEYILDHYKDGYIAFLDADDYWCENAITESVYDKLCAENETDIFAFGGFRSDSKNKCFSHPYGYMESISTGGNSAIWSLKGQFVANIYSISLLRQYHIRFYEDLKYSEDVIFRLQCAFLSKYIHYMPQKLYCYQENPSSAMSKVLQIAPIDYYLPIINGWIRSDNFLNQFACSTGTTCRAGHVLAGIYFLDMAVDHYKRGYKRIGLENVLTSHPHFYTFTDMRLVDVSPRQYKKHLFLKKHPLLFGIKYHIVGKIESGLRYLVTTRFGKVLRNRIRYPLTEMPYNE